METQYTIAKASSAELLVEEVQSMIQKGWVLQGGVAVGNASSFIFAQALIKSV